MPEQATPEQKEEQPSFMFLRATPADMMKHPPLASSLQSFETCLLLIALGRLPSALASCAAAVESAIKAKLGTPPEDEVKFWKLIQEIRQLCPSLRLFDESKLDQFRDTRNRVVHYGYTAKDDEVCAVQLLETGFPFLEKCYGELFGFEVAAQTVKGKVCGLEAKLARHYDTCKRVYLRARQLRGISYQYCFNPLAQYIRLLVKQVTTPIAEANVLEIGVDAGLKYEHKEREKQRILEKIKGETEEFDCPICDGQSRLLAQLDEGELVNKRVSVRWCYCVSCGMVVGEGEPYLADELLRVAIGVKTTFMKEFGIG